MCGIVGYVGGRSALEVVVEGLRRLEYRGYDSAGVALLAEGGLATAKRAGKLANLDKALADEPLPPATTGIGHTRWATHGAPNDRNAHPHVDCTGSVAVIHNGIIENFAQLRTELEERGHTLLSDTDTEAVAHLLEEATRDQAATGGPVDLAEAMRRVCRRLEGAFTLVATHVATPDVVVGARRNSPLVAGRGDGENFLASDVAAFIAHTRDAVELGQDQVVEVSRDAIVVTDFDGNPGEVTEYHVDWDLSAAEKGGYDYFMLKEIAEQPQAVADTLLGRLTDDGRLMLDEMRLSDDDLREVDKIIVVACGTAYHSGLVAKYAIEHWTRIPCEVELASEFRYRDPVLTRSTLIIAISQSGETMDTLMALRHAREQRSRVLAICNTNGSTIPRESDAVLYTHAGPEVAVASTKGYLTQIVACFLVGLYLAQVRGTKYGDEISGVVDDLRQMPDKIATGAGRPGAGQGSGPRAQGRPLGPVPRPARRLPDGARRRAQAQGARLHAAEGFAAGELKHGPIALIEEGVPVSPRPVAPRAQRPARQAGLQPPGGAGPGARTIVIAEDGDTAVEPYADLVSASRSRPPSCSRCSRRCRCRSSPARWRVPAATTSTSREPGQVGHRRVTSGRPG